MNEKAKCCICGGDTKLIRTIQYKDVVEIQDDLTLSIMICDSCGFIFNSTPYTDEQLSKKYTVFSNYEFDTTKKGSAESAKNIKDSLRQYDFIQRNISDVSSILEVGAASGYNLSLYKKCGMETFGVEPSPMNTQSAKHNYGVDMFCGLFDDFILQSPTKTYNLVFLSHVLEHISNPFHFIEQISAMNDKYIFIEVPCLDYKFVDEPFGLFFDEHINYFTLESLQNLMNYNNYGLKNAYIHLGIGFSCPAGLPAIVSIWEKGLNHDSVNLIRKSKDLLEDYIEVSDNQFQKVNGIINDIPQNAKLAIWGCGNHTSRILASTNLAQKNIVRFYDSDPKKKKKKIMGIEITAFEKDDIVNGIVDTILISTFVAQKQIADYIQELNIECRIITLY